MVSAKELNTEHLVHNWKSVTAHCCNFMLLRNLSRELIKPRAHSYCVEHNAVNVSADCWRRVSEA